MPPLRLDLRSLLIASEARVERRDTEANVKFHRLSSKGSRMAVTTSWRWDGAPGMHRCCSRLRADTCRKCFELELANLKRVVGSWVEEAGRSGEVGVGKYRRELKFSQTLFGASR